MRTTAVLLAALQLLTGCYTYVPARSAPPAGAQVSLEISDEGRVALAPALGPGALRVRGTLATMEGSDYVVDAAYVTPIRGQELPVSGIRVRIAPSHVTSAQERQLSRRRTALVIGGAVLAAVTFLVSKGFRSGYTPPEDGGNGGPDQ